MLRAHCLVFVDFLTSCKIAQVELASEQEALLVWGITFDKNLEDSVRSRRMDVRACLPCYSIGFSSLEQGEAILGVSDHIFALAFYEDPSILVLSDIQSFGGLLVLEKIE